MSGFNYTKITETAKRLLERFGQEVTLVMRSEGAYNTATGSSVITETSITANGVMLDYKDSEIDGTRVQQGDVRCFMESKADAIPKSGDLVVIDSINWTLVEPKKLKPGPVLVLYDLQLRR